MYAFGGSKLAVLKKLVKLTEKL